MAGLVGKLGQFLKSPEGRRVAQQAQRALKDPATRRKLTDAVSKFRGGAGGTGAGRPR
ncbi:hypothetical protein [Kineococcus sp. SYSU DK002]|uniref:hypothetical protein n=1 Tax=Kineococcus sp. SYSU DK002 TaxID=3383123 RepID=UPI003D7CA5F9